MKFGVRGSDTTWNVHGYLAYKKAPMGAGAVKWTSTSNVVGTSFASGAKRMEQWRNLTCSASSSFRVGATSGFWLGSRVPNSRFWVLGCVYEDSDFVFRVEVQGSEFWATGFGSGNLLFLCRVHVQGYEMFFGEGGIREKEPIFQISVFSFEDSSLAYAFLDPRSEIQVSEAWDTETPQNVDTPGWFCSRTVPQVEWVCLRFSGIRIRVSGMSLGYRDESRVYGDSGMSLGYRDESRVYGDSGMSLG